MIACTCAPSIIYLLCDKKKRRNACTIARTRVPGIIYSLCIKKKQKHMYNCSYTRSGYYIFIMYKKKAETRVRLLIHASRVIKNENRKRNARTSNRMCVSGGVGGCR